MVDVIMNGPDNTPVVEAVPVQESDSFSPTELLNTPIKSLKARRKEIVDGLHKDLRVPRWENPQIWVRYQPVNATKLVNSLETRRKSKDDDWLQRANADVLIDACVGIYQVFEGSDEKLSLREDDPHGSWTKFDVDLAKALDLPTNVPDAAVNTVRGLYFADGDLNATIDQLMQFSNLSNDQADISF